jgi:hypothetical protein
MLPNVIPDDDDVIVEKVVNAARKAAGLPVAEVITTVPVVVDGVKHSMGNAAPFDRFDPIMKEFKRAAGLPAE